LLTDHISKNTRARTLNAWRPTESTRAHAHGTRAHAHGTPNTWRLTQRILDVAKRIDKRNLKINTHRILDVVKSIDKRIFLRT